MDRTTSTGYATNAANNRIFVDENLLTGVDGTDVLGADMTSHQEEIMGIIQGFGGAPNAAILNQAYVQIAAAIAANGGAAEAYASQFNPGRYLGSGSYGANNTLVIPAGCTKIRVYGCGGGGGGAGCNVDYGAVGNFISGAGGGSGGFGIGEFAVVPGQSLSVIIGAGGSGGLGGGISGGNISGGTGGTTSLGSLISFTGGGGGLWNSAIASAGGAPGLAYGATIISSGGNYGSDGQGGSPSLVFAGNGGAGPWGGGGRAGSGGGEAAGGFGGGGGGAYSAQSTYVANGAYGAAGVLIVEFYTA